MKILNLTLKKKWFNAISEGIKKEEYREIKPYWQSRLLEKPDVIRFKNGYKEESPSMMVECLYLKQGIGKEEWGASPNKCFILGLGKIINKKNIQLCKTK